MTLCVFALIAFELMPVSLLTPIATALNVSEGFGGIRYCHIRRSRSYHQPYNFLDCGDDES
ncbi:hypothetical protein PS874_01674 [Pseudomonas fluorescens]|jgi:hypothetical protein|nr:hypothetical protein PS874_01674 [Pseudomonas fluorescens]